LNNLYRILDHANLKYKDHSALVFAKHTISYSQLKEATDRLAAGFSEMGIEANDRFAIMLPSIPHFIISYFALLKIGATIVPVSTFDKAVEIHHQLEDSEVRGIIYLDKYRQTVQQAAQGLEHCKHMIVLGEQAHQGELRLTYLMEIHDPMEATTDVSADTTALIVYTAGITGRPKGAELTHGNLLAGIDACVSFFKLKSGDSVGTTVPFFLPIGLTLIIGAFFSVGATLLPVQETNIEQVIEVCAENHPNYFISYPSLLQEMLAETEKGKHLKCLDYWLTSGDAVKVETMEKFESQFHIPVLEGYSITEASSVVSFNAPNRERKAGSIGIPLPGIDLKIVDSQCREVMANEIGEIIIQGSTVMKGYLNRPEATKEVIRDGWLYTGDLAQLDESGFGFVVARKKNVIMKSGFSVYPREVENCLSCHPQVKEAVVIGLPDNLTGEEIHAYVVLKQDQNASPSEIIEYARERMAAYKCPKTVTFMLSIPKGPGGRILREEVRQILQEKLSQKS
jgi:long-chain acyl-CoA synthetase